jgi:plastocyanin
MPSEEAAAHEPETFTVNVDGQVPDMASYVLAYFPQNVSAHPGDTVEFQWVDTGEPHTVTFGSLVDEAVASMAGADPMGPMSEEFEALPVLIDEATFEVSQAAAQPCYLTDSDPGTEACTADEQEQVPFDGNFTYYNSGWPEGAATFSVDIDPDTAPGIYNYLCLLHLPFMTGSIEVVAHETEIDTPEDVTARGEEELAPHVEAITEAVESAVPATPNDLFAGIVPMSDPISAANIFEPLDVTIPAGESVTWTIMGPHLMAFNAPPEAASLRSVTADGTVVLNMAGIGPAGGSPGMPAPPPEAEEAAGGTPEAGADADATPEATMDPNAPPPPPMVIDGGEWNGEGYYNSSLFPSFPPDLFAFKMAFTEPGTYPYQCLVHPGMNGTITVE